MKMMVMILMMMLLIILKDCMLNPSGAKNAHAVNGLIFHDLVIGLVTGARFESSYRNPFGTVMAC